MATAKSAVCLLLILSCFCSLSMVKANPLGICRFDKIFQLGDSISDTGNLIRERRVGPATAYGRLPYGQDFFHRTPTGRCSNGLLMIDFIARAAGLPLLHAYKDPKGEFSHGVNFAVAGSTALPLDTLAAMRVFSPGTRSSLHVQLDWLFTYLNSTCTHHHQDCVEKVQNALFMVGEIGGNDYNFATFQGKKSMDELRRMVPRVVKTILYGVRRTIELGAKRVVVPGNFPVGCIPIYKTAFQTNNSSAYDNNGCLKHLNEFAEYHNRELQNGINRMIQEKPNAIIVYADYYKAYEFLLHFAKHHGMDWERACCGIGGKYNFNTGRMCGARGVPVCRNAHRYVSWDGIHMTQQGYRIMSGWLVRDLLPKLHCLERLP